jgi:predicted transcriptional regulator
MTDRNYTKSESSVNPEKHWRFVTNHTQVLLSIASKGDVRLRDIAVTVGITERAAQRILADLVEAGYVTRERIGRRNHYEVNPEAKMRHPSQRDQEVGGLLELLRLPDPAQETSTLDHGRANDGQTPDGKPGHRRDAQSPPTGDPLHHVDGQPAS